MYDYMAFILVGIVVLTVGILIGLNLAEANAKRINYQPAKQPPQSSVEQRLDKDYIDRSTADIDNVQGERESAVAEYRKQIKTHLLDIESAIDTLTSGYDKMISSLLESNSDKPTNKLVNDLTQSYQDVYSSLSESAKVLIDDPDYLRRLDARRDKAVLINTQQRINKAQES